MLKMGSFEVREGYGKASKLFKVGGGCLAIPGLVLG